MGEALADARVGAGLLAPGDLAAEVDGAQRVINAAGAVQMLRVAQFAGREQEPARDGSGLWVEVDYGVGHVSEFAADCVGPMLAMSPVAAGRKVDTAVVVASCLPVTLAAMGAGSLDSWRATIIAAELSEAGVGSCAAVEALVFPAVLAETPAGGEPAGAPGAGQGRFRCGPGQGCQGASGAVCAGLPVAGAGPDVLGGVVAGG